MSILQRSCLKWHAFWTILTKFLISCTLSPQLIGTIFTVEQRAVLSTIRSLVILLTALFLVAMLLFGCASVGPDYTRPATRMPESWNKSVRTGSTLTDNGTPDCLTRWWTSFNDPQLTSLIERAVMGNLDLKKAKARVRQARAQRNVTRAGYFPTLDSSVSGTRYYDSSQVSSEKMYDLYNAGFDASWEIDVFGGTRRSVEAATADLKATDEDLNDVLVSLLAEVATNYVQVRTYQARIEAVSGNIDKQNETYKVALWRQEAGLGDELAVQEALYNFENTRSQLPALRQGLEESLNKIAVLLGEKPGSVHEELENKAGMPLPPTNIAVGVPANILRNRPDVRRAERQLAAQTARVGAATAALYPKFTLTGSIGIEALSLDSLASTPVRTYSFGPGISWPIFRGGSLRANIEVQSALEEQYLVAYEKSILGALEEVENILTAYAEEQNKRQSLEIAEKAARKAADIALGKYEAGLTDFLVVLVAQRSLLTFQDQLAQSDGTVLLDVIKLYKALGGGWQSLADGPPITQGATKDR